MAPDDTTKALKVLWKRLFYTPKLSAQNGSPSNQMHNLAVISNIDSSLSLVYCNETNRLKQGDVQSIWTGIPKNAPDTLVFFFISLYLILMVYYIQV